MSANQVSHLDRIKKFQLRADSLFDQNELASQGFEKCAVIDQQIVEKPVMLLGINPRGGRQGNPVHPFQIVWIRRAHEIIPSICVKMNLDTTRGQRHESDQPALFE